MTEYKLINPSDPYTFLAKTKEPAALAVFLLGTMYGASPKDDDEEKRIPVFLFGGAEEWYQEEFCRSTEEGLEKEKRMLQTHFCLLCTDILKTASDMKLP